MAALRPRKKFFAAPGRQSVPIPDLLSRLSLSISPKQEHSDNISVRQRLAMTIRYVGTVAQFLLFLFESGASFLPWAQIHHGRATCLHNYKLVERTRQALPHSNNQGSVPLIIQQGAKKVQKSVEKEKNDKNNFSRVFQKICDQGTGIKKVIKYRFDDLF